MVLLLVLMTTSCSSENNVLTVDETTSENDTKDQTTDDMTRFRELIEEDLAEFKVEQIDYTNIIEPPNTSGFYTYYETKSDDVIYFHAIMSIRNISTSNLDLEKSTSFNVTINNTEYTLSPLVESPDGSKLSSSWFDPIEPLTTRRVHYMGEVPASARDSDAKYHFKIGQSEYSGVFQGKDFEVKKEYINFGDTLTAENLAKITFEEYFTTQRLEPPDTSRSYRYYEVKDPDSIYVILKVEVEVLQSSNLRGDEVMGTRLFFKEKYRYNGFTVVQDTDGRGFSSYESMAPLTTRYLFNLFEVPKIVVEGGSIEVQIYFSGETYYIKLN